MSDRLLEVMKRAHEERVSEYVLDTNKSVFFLFTQICKQAEKEISPKFKNVTPHTLRHTWATLAARSGTDFYMIAGVMNASLQTILKNYAHHSPEHLRKAVNFRKNNSLSDAVI